MGTLSIPQAYQLLRQAGFTPAGAAQMVAIGIAESGLRTDAVGDVSLEDATWGPSVGLFQERTLKSETGTGGTRDVQALTGSPLAQARAAYETSGGGRNFTPWTTYTKGAAAANMGRVLAALGASGTGDLPSVVDAPPITAGGAEQAGLHVPNPFPAVGRGIGKLLHLGGQAAGDAAGAVGGAVGGAVAGSVGPAIAGAEQDAVQGLAKISVIGAGLLVGGTLVVLGFWRGVSPVVNKTLGSAGAPAPSSAPAPASAPSPAPSSSPATSSTSTAAAKPPIPEVPPL